MYCSQEKTILLLLVVVVAVIRGLPDKTSYGMVNSAVNAGGLDPLDRCIAHGLYCVLAVLAVSQTLLVGLNCLPLVLRDRVFGVLRQSRSLRKLMTASKYILSSRSLNHFVSTLFYFCDWLLAWLILISFDNASDGNAVTSAAEMVPSFLASIQISLSYCRKACCPDHVAS